LTNPLTLRCKNGTALRGCSKDSRFWSVIFGTNMMLPVEYRMILSESVHSTINPIYTSGLKLAREPNTPCNLCKLIFLSLGSCRPMSAFTMAVTRCVRRWHTGKHDTHSVYNPAS